MEYRGLSLDAFQEQAIQFIEQKKSLIISAPTGSGKTLIAEYAIAKALKEGKEVLYTAPIKALSNQKFRDFGQLFGREKVGIMTGDVSFNNEAPILIMTTEIFRNAIFEDPKRFDDVMYLILDEVHYLDDIERGSVWEESIIFAPPHIRILCLSATVPNVMEIADWISKIRAEKIEVVMEDKRPVPLKEICYIEEQGMLPFEDAARTLPKKLKKIALAKDWKTRTTSTQAIENILDTIRKEKHYPALYFVFSRKECEANAFFCRKYQLLNEQEQNIMKQRVLDLVQAYKLPKTALKQEPCTLLIRGIGYHHAGMIPALKEIVEQLFTEGLIKLLFATETFALGINMPARSVVFHALKKFDGVEVRKLTTLEYQQMAGRAGRRGIDTVGYVYTNLCSDLVTQTDLKQVLKGNLGEIQSQFNLSYSTLLALYERLGKDVVHACEKSLGAFHQLSLAEKLGGKQKKKQIHEEQQRLVKKKLTLLQSLGYLNSGGLTSKGRFACFVNGYEIQLTELFFSGYFEEQNETDLFIILVSLVFESKKVYGRKPKTLKMFQKLEKELVKRIQPAQSMEAMLGLKEDIRLPDFGLALASQAWAQGKIFTSLPQYTNISPGDIIRNFRQAIQLCRQLYKVCHGYKAFTNLLDRCLMTVNRDEVNALAQLKAFASIKPEAKAEEK
ncbi:MAG: DEAD/DEAH box helicase [Candidatus Brocadiae bacterium]|nr:DEAD/DEAH box helicase [Candidatus Brocadiia bacterium]